MNLSKESGGLGDVGRERCLHGSAKYLSPNDETGLIYTWVDIAKASAESESPQIILVSACDKIGSSRVVRWRRISLCKDFATGWVDHREESFF